MSSILSQLRRIASDLKALAIDHALIGGLAVSVHSEPRTTKDIDFSVLLNPKDRPESMIKKLLAQGYVDSGILMHVEPTHRLGFRVRIADDKIDPVAIDLLTSSCGIEPEIVAAATLVEIWPKLSVPVATKAHLIAMKVLSQNESDRLRDRADLQQLLLRASAEEIELSKQALTLIEKRGFSRGKKLLDELETILKIFDQSR